MTMSYLKDKKKFKYKITQKKLQERYQRVKIRFNRIFMDIFKLNLIMWFQSSSQDYIVTYKCKIDNRYAIQKTKIPQETFGFGLVPS